MGDYVGWVSDPNGRGTFGIVISCLATLTLCVWSAMHLNIAPHHQSAWQNMKHSVMWAVLAVFGPELVCFMAWKQYKAAERLMMELESQRQADFETDDTKINADKASASMRPPQTRWTMTHCFYAVMGGFTFEFDESYIPSKASFDPEFRRLTLTARAVAILAECGHLPVISKAEIEDKSKSDGLAKALVCVQSAWFVVQIIGRLVQQLPVTLLEVNTLGHIFCAFVIYLVWWHKPRGILEPTKLEGPWVAPLCAYMYMSSQVSGKEKNRVGLLRHYWADPEFSTLLYLSQPVERFVEDTIAAISGFSQSTGSDLDLEAAQDPRPKRRTQPPGDAATIKVSRSSLSSRTAASAVAEKRRTLAADALKAYPVLAKGHVAKGPVVLQDAIDELSTTSEWKRLATDQLVVKRASNFGISTKDLGHAKSGLFIGMIIWTASMVYGAIHAAAWYADFPTNMEAWIWRISSVWIAFSGLLWLAMNATARLFPAFDVLWNRFLTLQVSHLELLALEAVCAFCGLVYGFARVYLVVEAFLSLRRLPSTAYDTVDWSKYIPHI